MEELTTQIALISGAILTIIKIVKEIWLKITKARAKESKKIEEKIKEIIKKEE